MKKGFTLMEVLAVILMLAVVTTLTAPVFRAVRFEVRQAQAKTAAQKLAESLKTYYQVSRGGRFEACFQASDTNVTQTSAACDNPAATGIPASSAPSPLTTAQQLFACGFLSSKDFRGLPYTFCTSTTAASAVASWTGLDWAPATNAYVVAFANDSAKAGSKYYQKGYIYVSPNMDVLDTYDADENN